MPSAKPPPRRCGRWGLITLRRFLPACGSPPPPHLRRWESFGWTVLWYGTPDDYAMRPEALRPVTK